MKRALGDVLVALLGLGLGYGVGRMLPAWSPEAAEIKAIRDVAADTGERADEATCQARIQWAVQEERVRLTGNPRGKRRGE